MARYVLDRLFGNLTDKSYWNVDDWNNVDLLRIITRGSNSKSQLTIVVFSIAFAISVTEKVREFLNTPTMQYELRYKWWINAVVMILSVPHCLCWLFYFQNIITFLFEKLTCAVEILILSDAVDFLTMSLGMPYSVVTAQQACSTEMVKAVSPQWILRSECVMLPESRSRRLPVSMFTCVKRQPGVIYNINATQYKWISCAEISNMKNIIFSAKFTLTPTGVTLVNLRGREHKLPRDFLLHVWTRIDLCVLSVVIIFIANTQMSTIQAARTRHAVQYAR